jgi:TfoX/Sxy family transcriptional regulator of competence genes
MRAWAAAVAAEVCGWHDVTARSFFGFTALYRKQKIFALLPRTRNVDVANSLALKLGERTSNSFTPIQRDSRVHAWSSENQKARWFTFELSSDTDLHDALRWLEEAYKAAAKHRKSK